MQNYGKKVYWDKFYQSSEQPFEWLKGWAELKGIIGTLIKKTDRILNIGCGNACLTEDMYDNGYHNIVNMDISPIVIEQMKVKNAHRTNMIYEVGDIMAMKYKTHEFDVIIDKSTLDAITCSSNPQINIARTLFEIQRVLKTCGFCIIISFGAPDIRMPHFERSHLCFDTDI